MLANHVAAWLAAEGFGVVGDDIFVSFQPDDPDTSITVYDESAMALSESQALNMDSTGIRIMVRTSSDAVGYASARSTSIAIHKKLCGFDGPLEAGAPYIIMIEPVTAPTFLDRDDKRRPRWVSHYVLVHQSEGDEHRQ